MISIIIPVLNEEKTIKDNLLKMINLKGDKEIIISDGGSKDKTVDIASKYAKVIKSEPGRAIQMNTAARVSKGDILWFVHCDSILCEDSLFAINKIIDEGKYSYGCFSLFFYDYNDILLKFIAKTSNIRAKYLKLIFGDQGLFVKKDIFESINGFKELPIMEDWDISRRLSGIGKAKILDNKIGTSARRFKKDGVLKTFIKMQKIKYRYIKNEPIEEIAKIYKEVR